MVEHAANRGRRRCTFAAANEGSPTVKASAMTTSNPGLAERTVKKDPEPLLVRPRTAWRMLGCGNTRGYALLASGDLESFLDGRARKITIASIRAYVARKIAATSPPIK
jgi:hypothetical protein